MSKIPNYSRLDKDDSKFNDPYVAGHDFLPVYVRVKQASQGNRYGITAGDYYVHIKNELSRRNREQVLKGTGAYDTYSDVEDAKDRAKQWQRKHPLPGLDVTMDEVEKAWDMHLEKHANMENARIHANVGDAEQNDGVQKKVAKFGDMVAVASADDVGGEIVSKNGELPDIDLSEMTNKGGRVPGAEAEVQTFNVAEDVAEEVGASKEATEAIVNIVEKQKGYDIGDVAYRATNGRVMYYGDTGLRDVANVPQSVGSWELTEWSENMIKYNSNVRKAGTEFNVGVQIGKFGTDSNPSYRLDGFVNQVGGDAEADFSPTPDRTQFSNAREAYEALQGSIESMEPDDYLDDVWQSLVDDLDLGEKTKLSEGDMIVWDDGTKEEVVRSFGDGSYRLKAVTGDSMHDPGDTYNVEVGDIMEHEDEIEIK